VAVGPDGTLYLSEPGRALVRRVDPSGIITTFAGSGITAVCNSASLGDGGPATQACLPGLHVRGSLLVGTDGRVYILDGDSVRAVGTDGIIRRIADLPAGANSAGNGLAAAPDGGIYVSWNAHFVSAIYHIDVSGRLTPAVGTGSSQGFNGDGG